MQRTLLASLILVLPALSLSGPAQALQIADGLEISGNVQNQSSYRVSNPDDWSKIRDSAALKTLYTYDDALSAFLNVRYYYDSVYDANDEYSAAAAHDLRRPRESWDWLRECYGDYDSDLLDARLGRQTVVWGTADGVKVLDVVCPMDMREFTTAPFDESRIPLWMGKVEISPKLNATLQALLIPWNFEANYIPPDGSPWTFRATRIGAQSVAGLARMGYRIRSVDAEPADVFENAKFGFRWLDVIGNFEYTLNYLQGYNISSVTDVAVDTSTAHGPPPSPGLPPLGSTYIFTKEYPYVHILGTSFSYGIDRGLLEGLTIRGEFAYTRGDRIGYGEDGRQVGLTEVDTYNYVIGLDKYFFVKYLFSFQFIQMITSKSGVDDPRTGVSYPLLQGATYHPRSQCETMLSLKVATQFLWDRLKPELFVLCGQHGDWRVSPAVSYEITDDIVANVGTHLFYGPDYTLLGQFKDNKQVFAGVKYGF